VLGNSVPKRFGVDDGSPPTLLETVGNRTPGPICNPSCAARYCIDEVGIETVCIEVGGAAVGSG
jgi:hypothetical protein